MFQVMLFLVQYLLKSSSEADRCIKILEALSLRGNFWPGACASALKDLQKALIRKSTAEEHPSQTVLQDQTGQFRQNGMSQNIPLSRHKQAPSRGNGEFSSHQATSHATESSFSPSIPPSEFTQQNPPGAAQNSQSTILDQVPSSLNIGSQDMPAPLPIQGGFIPSTFDFNYGDWQGMGLNFGHILGGGVDQIDDIFQLMDVPYQLSEQILEPNNIQRY